MGKFIGANAGWGAIVSCQPQTSTRRDEATPNRSSMREVRKNEMTRAKGILMGIIISKEWA
jgi:hypothetical protein